MTLRDHFRHTEASRTWAAVTAVCGLTYSPYGWSESVTREQLCPVCALPPEVRSASADTLTIACTECGVVLHDGPRLGIGKTRTLLRGHNCDPLPLEAT